MVLVSLVSTLALALLSGCAKPSQTKTDLEITPASFRDIPGITNEEIDAIEALQKKYGSFVFRTTPPTWAFTGKNGEIDEHGARYYFCQRSAKEKNEESE
jgi:hypothetical protein